MPIETTATYQLADDRLDGRLEGFVAERRSRTPQLSWRHIARELLAETGVDVSDQTLMNWFPEYRPRTAGGRWDSEGTYLEREQ